MQPAPDVWRHLIDYVLPPTLVDTALLLGGVAALALLIGAGTAWLISLHDFRGRRMLVWLLPLPLAIPTYLAAYVYADLFEPLGLVHRTLALWFPLRDVVVALPNLRSLPGAIIVIGLVLYPYVYLSARAMFQLQSAEFTEAARTLGAGRWTRVLARLAADGAAGAGGRRGAGVAGNAERYRRQRISRRPHAHGVDLHDLAQSRQPRRRAQLSCFMLAIVAGLIAMERYGRRNATTEFSAESPRLTPRTLLTGFRGGCGVRGLPAAGAGSGFSCRCCSCCSRVSGAGCWRISTCRCGAMRSTRSRSQPLPRSPRSLLGFATILAWRWRPSRLRSIAMNISQTGYALPGLVLALGLLTPVLAVDNGLNTLAGWMGRSLPGLIVVGSGAPW